MLYGFSAKDVSRLRQLLAAYERGRLRIDAPSAIVPDDHQADSTLGYVGTSIPAGQLGTAYLVGLDTSVPTPGQTQLTLVPTVPVYNSGLSPLATGTYLLTREPSQGYYVPANAGSTTTYQSAGCSGYSLTTSWATVAGMSLSLPAGSTWVVIAQLCATITSSSSGAGDSVSCRLFDGTTVYGAAVEFCDAVCAAITDVDAAVLVAPVVATSAIELVVQGQINSSSGSTGTIYASTGALGGSTMTAMRLN